MVLFDRAESLAQTAGRSGLAETSRALFGSKDWLALEKSALRKFEQAAGAALRFVSDIAFVLENLALTVPEYKLDIALRDSILFH